MDTTYDGIKNSLKRVSEKHPQLASRARKAESIVVVAIMPKYAVVKSQSDDDTNYIVWLETYKCNCTDYTTGQAPVVNGKKFCKHGLKVAAQIYSEKGEK